ncbi:flagellar biosynthetic protein FliO [Pseudochrobactrum algeriensis]|uniref:flagellar biosynthetic protein FliO n=1 Tax=Pseudochrobactrum algeriensis TaxID=2834768 RepID=UPI001BD01ABB|nr:flagellar biosynthetic protein FliO [Pseudochrobactrum algeriensis]MBX8811038.1 hypothetical protein [Ochrobactrum sp. MR34]QVQ35580.1 flagellar biosynthetic protein FliO [Pseudochrobactrum algeriensis]QVQ38800.1 flagellar biosynthetic protein FliO [Pseudochrobactrum algeriensis]QVQ42712.1 flagellar biosynthetic protein FliO [Pseudochrobactrum algeriensis]
MMDWLSGLVGENTAHIISFIGLFALFLAGVFVVFAAIKRMTAGTYVTKNHDAAPRLTVTDAAAVDGQRRLVLVRRDDVEHLILIGGPSDIVIEQNITRHQRNQPEQATPRARPQEELAPVAAAIVAAPAAPQISAAIATPELNIAPADIISAVPTYKPEAEATPAQQPRPAAAAAAQTPVAAPSQPLQTHAQQVAAAARQQQQRQAPVARPAETAPKLHPVYPLGQVSRGVVAATSGLAAASNAAQQELIAAAKRDNRSASPSLDDVRPGPDAKTAEGTPLVLQRATPQIARPAQQEPSFSAAPAPAAKPAAQPNFELDLESAVADALSDKDLSSDNEISFEDLLSSEMEQHFASTEKAEPAEKPQSSLPAGMLDISPRK